MTTSSIDLEKRLLAATVFELRVLLASQLDESGPTGMAARLAYALHNQALATLEGRPFDVAESLTELQRLEPLFGREYLQHFGQVVRNEA